MTTNFNFTELRSFTADLGTVAGNTGPFINSAVQFTSKKVKKSTQDSLKKASPRWRRLAGAVDYEITTFQGFGASVINSDIGYNTEKVLGHKAPRPGSKRKIGPGTAGNLGNLREYGAPNLAPHNDLQKALKENEADFEKGIADAIDDALKAGGL
jgi:hypothetical protein